jgi:hypothetical protein
MKNDDAQFILNGYRPNGQDAKDPAFAEALEQAKRDPALGEWFARQQAHDAAVSGKLQEAMPPVHLRAAILAGSRMAQPVAGRRWMRPAWIGFAASLVLGAVAATLLPARASAEAEALHAFALLDAGETPHGRPVGTAAKELKLQLEQDGFCLATGLQFDFETLRTTGCRTLTSNDHDMVEICFKRNGEFYHLYIVKRADFANLRLGSFASPQSHNGVSFFSWGDEKHMYMLTSRAKPEIVAQLL